MTNQEWQFRHGSAYVSVIQFGADEFTLTISALGFDDLREIVNAIVDKAAKLSRQELIMHLSPLMGVEQLPQDLQDRLV